MSLGITSELIPRQSEGVFLWPPIVIEECLETHIQPLPVSTKFDYWKQFDVRLFASDKDPIWNFWEKLGYVNGSNRLNRSIQQKEKEEQMLSESLHKKDLS